MRWTKGMGLKAKMAIIFVSVTLFTGLCGLAGTLYIFYMVNGATTSIDHHEVPLLASASQSVLSLYRLRVNDAIHQSTWSAQALEQQDAKIKEFWQSLNQALSNLALEVKEMGQSGDNESYRVLQAIAGRVQGLAVRYKQEQERLHQLHHELGQFMVQPKPDEPYLPVHLFLDEVLLAHIRWLDELKVAVENQFPFRGQTDPRLCSYGLWYHNFKASDPKLLSLLERAEKAHQEMHLAAGCINMLIAQGGNESGLRRDFKKDSGNVEVSLALGKAR